jgi:hypothetical protein
MGALLVLNLASNQLGELVAPAMLPEGWTQSDGFYKYEHADGKRQDECPGAKPEGIIALTNAIPDMRALTSLILKDNKLLTPEAGKALSDMLAANTVLKQLDVSSNNWRERSHLKGDGPGFAKELAVGISDNGAISSINLLKNLIPIEQAQELVKIMQAKENLTTLCGLSREEAELDFSGQYLRAGDAMLIANDISDMGALTKLMFGDMQVVTMITEMTEANFSGKLESHEAQIAAAFLPKCT